MNILYIGHSCFKLESDGCSIIIDPYKDDTVPGYENIVDETNMILSSHDHDDHKGASGIKVVDTPEGKNWPFEITVIDSFHDTEQGAIRGKNKIHIISDGKTKVAHLGDICCELTPEQKQMLSKLDATMIPVGGKYTLDGAEARALIVEIDPRISIPMHYHSEKHGFGFPDLAVLRRFTSLCSSVVELKTSTIDAAEEFAGAIVVLKPRNS